jgi:hypothetical protein
VQNDRIGTMYRLKWLSFQSAREFALGELLKVCSARYH